MKSYIGWAATHLGAWCLILLVSFGVGRTMLRRLDFASLAERLAFTLILGMGSCALFLFALGLVGLLYEGIIVGLTVAGALGALVPLSRSQRKTSSLNLQRLREAYSVRGAAIVLLIGLFVGYWLLLLVTTQYPPGHWDAISHHLPLAREFLAQHRIVPLLGIPHPVMPALNHMLFVWGLALKDDALAQMIEHTFLMLTAIGMYAWGARQGKRLFGLALSASWLASPLVLWLGESGYVDIALVAFVFLGVYALRVFSDSGETKWWLLAMMLLGMAAGVKLPGLFFALIGSGIGLWILVRERIRGRAIARALAKGDPEPKRKAPFQFTLKALGLGWALGALFLIPWYAYIFYHTGNPIWPTFPQWSTGIWGAPAVVRNLNDWLSNAAEPRTVTNFLLLSLDFIRYPTRFYGESNLTLIPLIVAWPIAWLFALWDRSIRWWVLWGLSFTLYWFFFPHQLRYWLPALPFALLALYETIGKVMNKFTRSALIEGTVWATLLLVALVYGGRTVWAEIESRGLPPVRPEARERYSAHLGGYRAVKYINSQLQSDQTVCVIAGSYLNYFIKGRVLDLYGLLQSGRLPQYSWPEDQPWQEWIESENVDWIFLNYGGGQSIQQAPKRNPVLDPFWPDYELVYADNVSWVFKRKAIVAEEH